MKEYYGRIFGRMVRIRWNRRVFMKVTYKFDSVEDQHINKINNIGLNFFIKFTQGSITKKKTRKNLV